MKSIHIAVLVIVMVAVGAGFFLFADDGPETVTVKVVSDDGIESVTGAGEYAAGDVAILKAEVKGDHFFLGWYDGDSKLLSSEMIFGVEAGNNTYYAKTSTSLTVETEGDLGVSATEGAGTYRNADSIHVDCTVKSDFRFEGWYGPDGELLSKDRKADIPTSSFRNDHVTVFAKTVSDKQVELKVDGDTGVKYVTGEGTYRLGETVTLYVKVHDEYQMEGWYDAGKFLGKGTELQLYAEDKTITVRTVHKPQISLELDGDEGISQTYKDAETYKGTKVTFGADLEPGYSFDGWYDKNGKLYSEYQWTEITAEEDLKLYAKTTAEYSFYVLAMSGVDSIGQIDYKKGEDSYVWYIECSKSNFIGWYDLDGKLLEDWDFFWPQCNDGIYVAKTNTDPYLGDNLLKVENYPDWYDKDSYCIVMDSHTKRYVTSYGSNDQPEIRLADGTYDIVYYNGCFDKSAHYETETVTFGDHQVRNFYWVHEDRGYAYSMDVQNSVFEHYRDHDGLDHDSWPESLKALCLYKDPYIVQAAEYLARGSMNMDELERADFVLRFVQNNTTYEYDEDYNGSEEYAKNAVMTLWEGRGDCEDSAVLYATLMKALGYDVVLLDFEPAPGEDAGHVAVGVALDRVPGGTYYELNGKNYYYCETTDDYSVVGEGWDKFDEADLIVI